MRNAQTFHNWYGRYMPFGYLQLNTKILKNGHMSIQIQLVQKNICQKSTKKKNIYIFYFYRLVCFYVMLNINTFAAYFQVMAYKQKQNKSQRALLNVAVQTFKKQTQCTKFALSLARCFPAVIKYILKVLPVLPYIYGKW